LSEFAAEIDVSDPEWTQILLNERISSLIKKGVVETTKLPRKLRLTDILEILDFEMPDGKIWENAERFDDVIRSYGEEPDRESMEEARDSLAKIIESLRNAANDEHEPDPRPEA
jgi:hypothetical protein